MGAAMPVENSRAPALTPPLIPPDPAARDIYWPLRWPRRDGLELGAYPSAVPCARNRAREILREWQLAHFTETAMIAVSAKNTMVSAWSAGIDTEEVRSKLTDTRIIRLALDALEEHLPAELESDDLTLEFLTLREKLAEAERRELRKIGHRDYMVLAPIDVFESLGGKAAAAIRTLDELGLVIRLDG
jgi:hypothetical protein